MENPLISKVMFFLFSTYGKVAPGVTGIDIPAELDAELTAFSITEVLFGLEAAREVPLSRWEQEYLQELLQKRNRHPIRVMEESVAILRKHHAAFLEQARSMRSAGYAVDPSVLGLLTEMPP